MAENRCVSDSVSAATLLKAAAAYLSATEGTVHYTDAQYHLRQQLRAAVIKAGDAAPVEAVRIPGESDDNKDDEA